MRILTTDRRIAPFGFAPGQWPLADQPLAQRRTHEIELSGIGARLSVADHAFVTSDILRAFGHQTRKTGACRRLGLSAHPALTALAAVSSIECKDEHLLYDVFVDAPEGASLAELRANAEPVLLSWEGPSRQRALPRFPGAPTTLEVPDGASFALHVEHWVHALWIGGPLVSLLLENGNSHCAPLGGRNVIGKNVQLHPSVSLENCVIADNVEIGAQSALHDCYVGPHSKLADFTKASYSVFGDHTHTLNDANFSEMVALGGGTLTNLGLSDSLLGRDAFVTTGVVFWSHNRDGPVSVERDGEMVSSERWVLGGCAGDGCILGARTIVTPGGALPGGTTVVVRKEEGMHGMVDDPARAPVAVHDG